MLLLKDDVLQIYSSMSTISWTLDIELSPKIRNSFILDRVMSLVFYTCIRYLYLLDKTELCPLCFVLSCNYTTR
jgi:hypothetical protein